MKQALQISLEIGPKKLSSIFKCSSNVYQYIHIFFKFKSWIKILRNPVEYSEICFILIFPKCSAPSSFPTTLVIIRVLETKVFFLRNNHLMITCRVFGNLLDYQISLVHDQPSTVSTQDFSLDKDDQRKIWLCCWYLDSLCHSYPSIWINICVDLRIVFFSHCVSRQSHGPWGWLQFRSQNRRRPPPETIYLIIIKYNQI